MNKPKFQRTNAHNYSKLGVRRKKKQIYRKSKGRDNKIRLSMKGHVRKVKIGFRTNKKERDLINGKKVVMVFNVQDLKKIKEDRIGVVGSVGNKKKKQIAEASAKDKVKLLNLDYEKFLKDLDEKIKKTKDESKERQDKKLIRDKKAKEKADKEKKEAEEKEKKEDSKKDESKLEDKIEEKKEEEKTEDVKDDKVEKKEEKEEEEPKVQEPKIESKDVEDTKIKDKSKGEGK
ncbi:MAG: eL32 family ribosomal protein [archaeon]